MQSGWETPSTKRARDFLMSLDILRGWPTEVLQNWDQRMFMITHYRRGEVVCRDSNKSVWLYFVMSGGCRVLKSLQHPKAAKGQQPELIGQGSHQQLITNRAAVLDKKMAEMQQSAIADRGHFLDYSALSTKQMQVFIEIQKISPPENFGLINLLFGSLGESTSVSLVSEGADLLLVNKNFFKKHMSETYARHLRCVIAPYPTESELQKRLQDHINWVQYKLKVLKGLTSRGEITPPSHKSIHELR